MPSRQSAFPIIIGGVVLLALPARGLVTSFAGTFAIIIGIGMQTPLVTKLLMDATTPISSRLGGVLGRMAPRSVVNSLSRTAIAIAALMIAISVTIGVSLMVGSFRYTVVAWLSQTTLPVDETMETVDRLRSRLPLLIDPHSDDIFYAIQNSQVPVKVLLAQPYVVIVVGSENSSNSVRLAEVARESGTRSYRIDDAHHPARPAHTARLHPTGHAHLALRRRHRSDGNAFLAEGKLNEATQDRHRFGGRNLQPGDHPIASLAVLGAVGDPHLLVGQVGAGGGHRPVMQRFGLVGTLVGIDQGVDRHRRLRGAQLDGVGNVLLLVQPVELPKPQPDHEQDGGDQQYVGGDPPRSKEKPVSLGHAPRLPGPISPAAAQSRCSFDAACDPTASSHKVRPAVGTVAGRRPQASSTPGST